MFFHMWNRQSYKDIISYLREKKPVFVCINDDLDETDTDGEVMKSILNFYNDMFPKKAIFEI
jgi:hypothetical protein